MTKDLYEVINNAFLPLIEELVKKPSSIKWKKCWVPGETGHNAQTKKAYSILNDLITNNVCTSRGYELNKWLTFKQVKDLGGYVRKGEKSTEIIFSKMLTYSESIEVLDDLKKLFYLKYIPVFNVAQIKGLPEIFYKNDLPEVSDADRIKTAEEIIKRFRNFIDIRNVQQDRAYYTSTDDYIVLPMQKQFFSITEYYSTFFHEAIHWTGHNSRINRLKVGRDKIDYAHEELVAELGAVYLCKYCGIDVTMENSKQYMAGWYKLVTEDKSALARAAMQAQSAMTFLLEKSGMILTTTKEEFSQVA